MKRSEPPTEHDLKQRSGRVIDKRDLPGSATAFRFEGHNYGDTNVSFFLTETPPGKGPGLHIHPDSEVLVVHEGRTTFVIADTAVKVGAGQIVVVPAGLRHRYINSGTETLRLIAIHPAPSIMQTFLENEDI